MLNRLLRKTWPAIFACTFFHGIATAESFRNPSERPYCEAPQKDHATWTYCNNPEMRKLGEELEKFEASLLRPPLYRHYRILAQKYNLNSSQPKTIHFCSGYARMRAGGDSSFQEKETQCLIELLNKRVEWAKNVQNAFDSDPAATKSIQEFNRCSAHPDPLMNALCGQEDSSPGWYAQVLKTVETINKIQDLPATKQILLDHDKWVMDMKNKCSGDPQSRKGCTPNDFQQWDRSMNRTVSEASQRIQIEAERASAVRRVCTVNWQTKQIRYNLTYYKLSNRAVLIEPASNMSGPPLTRISTKYEGVMAVGAGGFFLPFGGPWVFSEDPQAQDLINGFGGGVPLNSTGLGRGITQHDITFTDITLTQGNYIYIKGATKVNAPINCIESR